MEIMPYYDNKFTKIFLKKSGNLREIDDSSIDIVITSPPYNIGHHYGNYLDNLNTQEYITMLKDTIQGSNRVLKGPGLLVVDISTFIFDCDDVWLGAKFIERECSKIGLSLSSVYFYLLKKYKTGFFDMHKSVGKDYFLKKNSRDHSPIQSILIFSKSKNGFTKQLNFKRQYLYDNPQNDTFWSDNLVDDFIMNFDLCNKYILDPFMGSGNIGLKCSKRGCMFIGYDIEKTYIDDFIKKAESDE